MPKNALLEDAIVQFIEDNPAHYTPLHKVVYERTRGRPFADVADAIRPLALGRLAALRAGKRTVPYCPVILTASEPEEPEEPTTDKVTKPKSN